MMSQRRRWLLLCLAAVCAAVAAGSIFGVVYATSSASRAPDVVGLTVPEAVARLDAAGYRLGVVSTVPGDTPGRVVTQSPAANTPAGGTAAVDVAVAERRSVPVPDVAGMGVAAAEAALADVKLVPSWSGEVFGVGVPGTVAGQDPAAGAAVLEGSTVTLTVHRELG